MEEMLVDVARLNGPVPSPPPSPNTKRKRDIADAMGALDEISDNPNIPENVYRLLANGLKARHDEVGEVAGLWRIDE